VEKNHHWVSNNLDSLNDWLLEALNRWNAFLWMTHVNDL
jgi:hypothetical protein